MPFYFIDTVVDAKRTPDRIGMEYIDAKQAMKTALWALLDIVHDEASVRTEMDVTVVVKDLKGKPIFHATLSAETQRHSGFRGQRPIQVEAPAAAHLQPA